MNRVRLLPIVIVAASGLLVLKSAELVTSGQEFFASTPKPRATREEDLPSFARALARHRFTPPDDQVITGSVPGAKKDEAKKDEAKKDEAKKDDSKKAGAKPDPKAAPKPEANPAQVAQASQAVPPPLPQGASPSERALLERLQERRGSLDDRARELEMRENLLKAAEKKVDGRIGELKEVEDRLSATARAEKEEADRQMKSIVIMYETMKPKDAARVFDRLNLGVLVPIATAMNPRKMSEVLAVMSPEAAERLTVALAAKSREGSAVAAAPLAQQAPGELPRIDQPAAAPAAAPARPQQPRR
jgi:flagellar motility protein MotE (MotC chaperone)